MKSQGIFYKFFSITLLLISNIALGSPRIEFKNKAYISMSNYLIDDNKKVVDLKCQAYSNPSKEGALFSLKSKDIVYKFECRRGEVSNYYNLEIFKSSKKIAEVKNAIVSGGDCSDYFESQVWLQDLDNDGHIDIYQLSKTKFVPGCEPGKHTLSEVAHIYFWKNTTNSFKKEKVSPKRLNKLKKRFNYNF